MLPFSAGACAGIDGEFFILAFPDPEDPPIAYAEGLFGDVYLESKEEVDRYGVAWSHLLNQALSPAESAALLAELAQETACDLGPARAALAVAAPHAGSGVGLTQARSQFSRRFSGWRAHQSAKGTAAPIARSR